MQKARAMTQVVELLAWQAQGPEFKPQYYQKNLKSKKERMNDIHKVLSIRLEL
jgi:hypothetical protein